MRVITRPLPLDLLAPFAALCTHCRLPADRLVSRTDDAGNTVAKAFCGACAPLAHQVAAALAAGVPMARRYRVRPGMLFEIGGCFGEFVPITQHGDFYPADPDPLCAVGIIIDDLGRTFERVRMHPMTLVEVYGGQG